ncbi:hypothetical protein A2917_02130 [Candidatus Nomurabacteria bacterium RIFCSPLOWO2_01_FULL_42_17]|uniref:DoxX family protein n=1 Tax=Candidatus Nomurabacteria bacterium RIFCSPLOWO2_01_FULL_42_17 TaxID=1801780 RepID=A0A1F6XML5_9BACT|nr:MAG: hypothetical protein A2917_02130 [Candidatus Nomurabacteria bacterium RIFCSPLOWO2_01_FULL_42_17]
MWKENSLRDIDIKLINFFRRASMPMARFSLFVIFFWFGILKVIGVSSASPLVQSLFERTISFMSFDTFIVLFGIFECVIGILFIIRGFERVVIPMLFAHMATTFMPLFLLPAMTWSGFLVPTLEGQYIIKNLLIIAVAIAIAAHLEPFSLREKISQKNLTAE